MRIEAKLAQSRIRLDEPVRLLWALHGDGGEPVAVWRDPHKIRHLMNGDCVDWAEISQSNAPKLTIQPGERATIETAFEPSFSQIYRDRKAIERFAYACEVAFIVGDTALVPPAAIFEVEVDLRDVEPMTTPTGLRSHYVVDGTRVLYVSDKSRSYEGRTRLLKVDRTKARVLDEKYLVAGAHAFRDGRPLKGIDALQLCVLSPVFATDRRVVLTSHGNAKVADPASFKALDSGDAYVFGDEAKQTYRAGFGRDAQFVYFFDESTSTPHAVRLSGCKDPSRFVPLGGGYGKDDRSIFREATRIAGTDPSSFRVLGDGYAADQKSAYYGTARIEGADVRTFEVLPPPVSGARPSWARDAVRYYQHGKAHTKEEYDSALRRQPSRP
jgi:hypothetical protein